MVAFANKDSEEWKQILKNIDNILNNVDLSALDEYISKNGNIFTKDYGTSAREIIKALINGNATTDFTSYLYGLLSSIFGGVSKLIPTFAIIIAISLLSSISSTQLSQKSLVKTATDSVKTACIFLIILISSSSLLAVLDDVVRCVDSLKRQVEIIMPILLTLTVLTGGSGASAIYQPSAIFLSGGAIELVSDFVIPVTVAVIVFNFISRITPNVSFSGTAKLIKSILKWIIGITVTVYSIFLGVQSTTTTLFDGILFKATKYLLGNSVPIVGNFLSGGVDLLSASGSLIRSSVGLSGIIMLLFEIAQPIIILVSFSLILKISAAIVQPLGDNVVYGLLSDLANDVEYFIAGLLMVAFMYVLIIMLVINSANAFI